MAEDFYNLDYERNVHGSAIYCPHCFRKQALQLIGGMRCLGYCDTCGRPFTIECCVVTTYITRKERTNG